MVRMGQVLGEAGVKQGLHVTMLKSHGTEMRGGYVRSQVVLSNKIIDSPMCENPDVLVALSQAAYDRFGPTVPEGGLIVYDPSFVETLQPDWPVTQKPFGARDISMEEFGRPIFANTIILGSLARELDGVLEKSLVLESILSIIPKFHEQNRQAFELGFSHKN